MRILIVEDDSIAVEILLEYLRGYDFAGNIDVATSFKEGKRKLKENEYDLLFLDMHLGDGKGIDIIKGGIYKCDIIFITSDPEYAVSAFELNALDYIVKPFSKERFDIAIQRISREKDILKEHIIIRVDYSFQKILIKDILYVKSNADYLTMYTENGNYTFYERLKKIATELPEKKFKKCHRSFIINIDKVSRVDKDGVYINETLIPVSISFKEELHDLFN